MKKKLIAGMTSAALLASLSAPAFAANFDDVKGTKFDSAVAQLKALGIVNGENGKYNPNDKLTRAQFAKIAVQVAGLAQAADFTGINVSPFNDVPAGHWAAGYIQVAKDAGLVNGVGYGDFAPEADVKYEEAVAVLIRILGYNDKLSGEWPSEYVLKATELKLLGNTSFKLGQAATRGDIALVAAATLSQPTVTYSADRTSFVVNTVPRELPDGRVVDDAVTLIDKNFATAVKTAVVTGSGALVGSDLQADELSVEFADASTGTYKVAADAALVGTDVASGFVGHEVKFIIDEDGAIIYVADATKAENIVSGTVDKLDTAANTLEIGGVKYYYLDASAKFIVNNSNDSNELDVANKDSITAVTFTGADGKKYISTAFVAAYESAAVVEAVSAKTAVSPAKINSVSLDDSTVITLNGQAATLSDIKKGDVYYVYYADDTAATVNSGKIVTKVEVFRTTVSGKLTSTGQEADGSTYYVVNGTKYVKNSAFTVSATAGNDYTFTLDRDGKVVAASQNTSVNSNKYYVMDAANPVDVVVGNEVKAGGQKFTVLKADGTTATFFVVRNSADTAANFTVAEAAYEGKFITFEFNDKGEVTAVAQPTVSSDVYLKSDGGVDATTKKLVTSTNNAYYVTDSTVIVEDSQGPAKATKIGFDALKNGQKVTLVADPDAQQNLLAVIVHDPTGTNAGLADVTGVFVGTKTVTEANSAGGTTTTTYAVVNVDGTNQELKLEAGYTGTSNAGDLVTVQDSETDANNKQIGDGTYDKLVAPTVTVSQAVYNDTTAANAFTYNSTGYVYTSATKVYVVQFSGATYTDTANRDAATVGNIADFTQLYGQAFDAAKFGVEFKTDGTQIAGRNVVDTIVVFLKK